MDGDRQLRQWKCHTTLQSRKCMKYLRYSLDLVTSSRLASLPSPRLTLQG